MLNDGSILLLPTVTSRVADSEVYKTNTCDLNVKHTGMSRPYPQSRTLVKRSCVSDDGSQVGGGRMATSPRSNEEPVMATTLSWQGRTLAFFTMYGELSFALTPEEFELVRTRLRQEWTFDGGFVS